jgi:hypothetical protein
MTPHDMIEKYIQLRNKVAKIKEEHTEQLKPYADVMMQIEGELLRHLGENQLDSIKSEDGTAYKQVVTSVTVDNWALALTYIKDNELWDLLEARVAKNATLTVMEETKKPVPGVKISQAQVLRVRAT